MAAHRAAPRSAARRIVLAAGLAALTACSTGDSAAPSSCKRLLEDSRPGAAIFMKIDATPEQIASVRRELTRSRLARKVEFISAADAFRELREELRNQPELAAQLTAQDLPASFRVELRSARDGAAVQRAFDHRPGVDAVLTPTAKTGRMLEQLLSSPACQGRDSKQAEIFMKIDATPAQIATVRGALGRSHLVDRVRFLSHDDALREFRKLFRNQPELAAQLTAQDLPTSFRVRLRSARDEGAFRRAFEPRAGVDVIIVSTALDSTLTRRGPRS